MRYIFLFLFVILSSSLVISQEILGFQGSDYHSYSADLIGKQNKSNDLVYYLDINRGKSYIGRIAVKITDLPKTTSGSNIVKEEHYQVYLAKNISYRGDPTQKESDIDYGNDPYKIRVSYRSGTRIALIEENVPYRHREYANRLKKYKNRECFILANPLDSKFGKIILSKVLEYYTSLKLYADYLEECEVLDNAENPNMRLYDRTRENKDKLQKLLAPQKMLYRCNVMKPFEYRED